MPVRRATVFPLLLTCAAAAAAAQPSRAGAANAVEFRGTIYVALPALLDRAFLDGRSELIAQGRTIEVRLADRRVYFEEGGDRVARDDQDAVRLRSPILVLGDDDDVVHYVPAAECAKPFGYAWQIEPSSALVFRDRRLALDVKPLRPPHLQTRVEDLKPLRRGVVLTAQLPVRRHLHTSMPIERLPAGTSLLVRRTVRLNGIPHLLATRCDESLETYAVAEDDLRKAARDHAIDGTHLGRVLRRLAGLANRSASINHGPRDHLPRTVAMTVDMCWSLRPYEKELFDLIERRGASDGPVAVTLFMTRWLAQYPDTMQRLIELSEQPGVSVTWGLHSWVHPKRRPFLNGYTPREVRDDALRLEHELLEWGIVPSVFYRFPGLVHDRERLGAILDLDLLSVDCESWVASMRIGRPPHRLPPRDGSILLVHGNGNEAIGITRLREWMDANPGWRWGSLNRFISDRDDEATTAPTARHN